MDLHPDCGPLDFLLGTWVGEGVGGYPTVPDFRFRQEIVFTHSGQAFLSYTSQTWSIDDGRPLAAEVGYWRPRPENSVEVLLTHPTGVTEVYVGEVTGKKIELSTDLVARTESAKEVTAGHRLYGLLEDGELAYAYDMAALGQELQPHLSARLHRSDAGGNANDEH